MVLTTIRLQVARWQRAGLPISRIALIEEFHSVLVSYMGRRLQMQMRACLNGQVDLQGAIRHALGWLPHVERPPHWQPCTAFAFAPARRIFDFSALRTMI